MGDPQDPVKAEFEGEDEDLYDVATWDVRSGVDSLAVSVYHGLHAGRTVLLIAVAFLLFVAQIALAGLLVLEEPVLGVLSAISVLPALGLAGYFWWGDPTPREPLFALAVTFLLAILFASFAAAVNTVLSSLFGLIPLVGMVLFFFLIVGPVEESVKWLAVRTYAYGSEDFQTVVDGAVYGAVAGLGFAAIENLVYILNTYAAASATDGVSQLGAATATATARSFVGPGHVIFSAYAGYYLGLAKFNPERKGPIVVKGLLIAAAIHALYNTVVTYAPLTMVTFVAFVLAFDGLLLAILVRKINRYQDYYDRVARGESA